MLKLLIILSVFGNSWGFYDDNLVLLTKKRSAFLEIYKSYADLAICQVVVPPETLSVSFKVSAEPFDLSIFGCTPEEVQVYVKKGSIPVLNPDNSRNPKWVRNITKSELHGLELLTDKKFSYINITSPEPGIYYFAAFFPYLNPDKVPVKQKGLSQHCTAFINILAYISRPRHLKLVTDQYSYQVRSNKNESHYYQFSLPPNNKEIILEIGNIASNDTSANITFRLGAQSLPSTNNYLETKTISVSDGKTEIPYWLNKDGKYFLEFDFDPTDESETSFQFSLNTVSLNETFKRKNLQTTSSSKLDPNLYKSASIGYYQEKKSRSVAPYILYELIKESGSESFLYTFNINHEEENEFMVPIPLNLTEKDFSVLKFEIEDIIDIGGTFEFSIDFRPPPPKKRGKFKFTPDSVDQIIVGCISQDVYEIPALPRHCVRNGVRSIAPVVINNTVDNSTVLIPFPEAGSWYASLKLFCKPCRNCPCYKHCTELLRECISNCNCNTPSKCSGCTKDCKATLEQNDECKNCNCDDNCGASDESCSSMIMFDLSSFPCVMGRCGPNGRCQFMVADGYIFSACSCRNKYRGMDCTDDSNATPFWKVILAQVLLISSNIIMLPCVYLAWKRKFYPEAVVYLSVFFFSSFYHACDVADDSIQFCITTYSSLQFGDFFSALLSIWATMLTISDLELKYKATLHVLAAIVLAYCTVIDRTGIWIFLLIAFPGLTIIGVCWYRKYKKLGKNFIKKRYLKYYFTAGAAVMGIGVLIYAFLQTSGNYMYLHSIWHCIVGVTVLIILPRPDTFPVSENL